MATFALQIVPASLGQAPTPTQLASARELLLSYISYIDDTVQVSVFSKPTLVDTGAAFEKMDCPLCNTKLDRYGDDDHNEWWYDMESKIYESETPLTQVLVMPCCTKELRADQLNFGKHALFANWMLRASEYELHSGDTKLDDEQLRSIEEVLGCKLLQLVCVNG